MKHTPGPWKAINVGPHWNNKQIDNYQIQYGDDGECISDHVYEAADAQLSCWQLLSLPQACFLAMK